MATHAPRLARLFSPTYASRINAQIVYPAQPQVVKPNELHSALARPLHVALYEPDRPAAYLAASLSYGIIKGRSRLIPSAALLKLLVQGTHSWTVISAQVCQLSTNPTGNL
jgi:hypothetical protein